MQTQQCSRGNRLCYRSGLHIAESAYQCKTTCFLLANNWRRRPDDSCSKYFRHSHLTPAERCHILPLGRFRPQKISSLFINTRNIYSHYAYNLHVVFVSLRVLLFKVMPFFFQFSQFLLSIMQVSCFSRIFISPCSAHFYKCVFS